MRWVGTTCINHRHRRAPRNIVYLICAALLAACAAPRQQEEEAGPPFWPAPPDLPRFQYELALRSDLSVAEQNSATRFKALLTGPERAKVFLSKPFDVAARGGRIIVSDTVARAVYLFDVPRRKLLVFGRGGEGELVKPLGVAVDNDINYYVADVTRRVVVAYESNGHFKKRIGGPDHLERPTDVAVSRDGSRIYVIDAGRLDNTSHRVVVFNADGEKLFTIGERGVTPGKFNVPTHGAVGPDGTLYVLDAGNFRVQAFSPDGQFLYAWGGVGAGFGKFARPRGIAVDEAGNVYVTDSKFGNFQVFNSKGQLLLPVGRWDAEDGPGHYSLIGGVAVDETNRIYVVDQRFKKVEVIRRLTEEEGQRILKEYKP